MISETELGREAIYLRGLFVHRHAGIEYAISELLVRARSLAARCPPAHRERPYAALAGFGPQRCVLR